MVGRYKRKDGKVLPSTRISNTTFIGSPEKFEISDHVFIGHFNFIDASNGLKIGTGCQVTNYVSILTHSSHQAIRLYGTQYTAVKEHVSYIRGPVEIGDFTFIGPHTVIMPGTKIGKGCLVSAFSYVKGTFPDFSVISGNPATVTGDTRELDGPYLDSHPELRPFYESWAGPIK